MDNYVYNTFGSATSRDRDIMVVIPKPLKTHECHDLCHKLDIILKDKFPNCNKELNTNICVIDDNMDIIWTFKGPIDECQNSIFTTYSYHDQHYPCIVKGMVKRDIPAKLTRCMRGCLSQVTRTEGNRIHTKNALKVDTIRARFDSLNLIDLTKLEFMKNNKENPLDVYKAFAFQLGQMDALLNGVELYDKTAIATRYPLIKHSIERCTPTQDSLKDLQEFKISAMANIKDYLDTHPDFYDYKEINFI